jgi:glucosamine--fructose-6-phosphate aminotransferase (isomerizing)
MSYQCYDDIKGQAGAWRAALAAVDERIEAVRALAGDPPEDLLFTSCGSPYFLGLANAALWREKLGVNVTVFPSSEAMLFPEATFPRGGNPLLLSASRSGETTETIRAVEAFSERFPGRTVLIGCKPGSSLDRMADVSVMIPEAYEDVIPQTRSFCSMYLAAQYLAALLAGDAELVEALRRLPELLPDLFEHWEPEVRRVAEAGWEYAVFLGGGPLYGVATEATLKLLEMSLSRAASYHTLEVRHGPRSVVDESSLIVGLLSRRGERHEDQVLSELAETARPFVLALSPGEVSMLGEAVTRIPAGGNLPEHALGLLYLPLLQLLAYHRALHRGVNPDESRNLVSYIELPEGG